MNLTTMDYFLALAEERSFTKAAEKLNITQQTLSANIANLEKQLDVKLVERSVPLQLTFAGEVFLGYAKRFQAEKRSLIQDFLDISGNEKGRLKVGVAATRGHIIMPSVIAEFQQDHPGIAVDLHEAENAELVEMLKSGSLDMIVAHVAQKQPSLVVKELYKDEVLLLASKKMLIDLYGDRAHDSANMVEKTGNLTYVSKCPFMLVGKRDVTGDIARQTFERSNIRPEIRVLSTNAETLASLAEHGVGACFSPGELVAFAYKDKNAGLRVIHLGKQAFYSVHAAWRRSEHTWSMIEEFVEILDRQLSDTRVDQMYI